MSKWISVKDKLPEKTGRYLALVTFRQPVIVNDSITRERVPFATNFKVKSGWTVQIDDQEVTHWMEIPPYN